MNHNDNNNPPPALRAVLGLSPNVRVGSPPAFLSSLTPCTRAVVDDHNPLPMHAVLALTPYERIVRSRERVALKWLSRKLLNPPTPYAADLPPLLTTAAYAALARVQHRSILARVSRKRGPQPVGHDRRGFRFSSIEVLRYLSDGAGAAHTS